MTRKLLTCVVLTLAFTALVAGSVMAKASFDDRVTTSKSRVERISDLSLSQQAKLTRPQAAPIEQMMPDRAGRGFAGPLGAAALVDGPGPGLLIDHTYEDWQWSTKGRHVDFRNVSGTQADIHFSYNDLSTTAGNRLMGYNLYDAVNGIWPHNQDAGCEIQTTDAFGRWATLDVLGDGVVVVAGDDGEPNVAVEHHIYRPIGPQSCFWGNGTQIPAADYRPGFFDETNPFIMPVLDIQFNGDDTILHVVGTENGLDTLITLAGLHPITYFRKVGSVFPGTWEEKQIIDTISTYSHHLAASRVSGKVAVMYTKVTDEGFAAGQGFDNDVWYRQSSDNGVTWDAAVNITSYDRTEASYAAWLECHGVYDTDDDLHVIWNATPVPANPDMDADFGEFSCNLFHWSQANDRIVKVADANYGGEVNTQVCGFGDFNTMYIGMFSISECAGNMYVVYGQIHRDVSGWTDLADVGETLGLDCASGGDRGSIANWEIMMKVSTDLTGDLWNAPRSISNTYTADCDSAGFGGECGSEYKATVSRYGLDEAGLGLTFPSAAVVDLTPAGDPAYSGTSYLQMLYESDLFPGSWWSDSTHGPATFNAMKWVRLACVDPVTASLIEVSPARVSYPEHGPNGVETTVPVWVYNSGNTGMDVTSISVTETSGSQAGWLDVSATAITAIPYQDSATFNIRINKDGLIDNGTTGMEFLDGYVLLENTSANNDSVIINIHFLLADTLEAVAWDTVTTTDPWGTTKAQDDFVGLTMSNIGGVGHNGIGGVNMDFSVAGGECANNDDVYLYDGSVFLMQNPGDTVHLSSSLHNQDFASPRSFKPLVPTAGEEMSSGLTADYDSVYTGKFVNWDTSIVMEQTYYAPRGSDHNPVFVVRKTTVTATGAGAVANLSIGSMNDWDIPSEDGSDNKTGIIASSATLYVQGTDTLYVPEQGCQDDTARFGAEAFLGWYTGSEFAGNSCVNNESYYGVWADSFHGWWDDAGDNDYAEVWDSVAANSGLNANNGTFDQAVFTTYVHNYTLAAGETVTFYNAYVTIRDGSTDALANAVLEAKAWYNSVLRGCETVGACCQGGLCSILSASKCSEVGGVYSGDGTVCDPNPCGSCCVGERGNVQLEPNCNPADQGVDVGDLTNLIDHLFINFTPICCTDEADISPAITGNPPDGSVDVGDLTAMIDHLFINFPALPSCN